MDVGKNNVNLGGVFHATGELTADISMMTWQSISVFWALLIINLVTCSTQIALSTCLKKLEAEHVDVATTYHNVGIIY